MGGDSARRVSARLPMRCLRPKYHRAKLTSLASTWLPDNHIPIYTGARSLLVWRCGGCDPLHLLLLGKSLAVAARLWSCQMAATLLQRAFDAQV